MPTKTLLRRALLLIFFMGPTSQALSNEKAECEHDKNNFRCVKVLKNYDGDTITVFVPGVHPLLGENISVRVNGIDTPEIKTSNDCEKTAGRAAQRLVENLLKNSKRVDLENLQRDKYFRILADVKVDGQNLKEILIKNRLAYEYHGGTKEKRNWCLWKDSNLRPR